MTAAKLEPCPFCGVAFTTRTVMDDGEWIGFDVHCHVCGFSRLFESEEEALRILNRRAQQGYSAEVVEAVKEMRRYHVVLLRLANSPSLWDKITKGTGISTMNGYNRRLEALEATLQEPKS